MIISTYFEKNSFPCMYNTYYLLSQQLVIDVYLFLQSMVTSTELQRDHLLNCSVPTPLTEIIEGNINSGTSGSLLHIKSYLSSFLIWVLQGEISVSLTVL